MMKEITRRAALIGGIATLAAPACAESRRLDLGAYRETFSDDFRGPLDVSARGPGTRWIAHTPWNGDFGDAKFSDPVAGFPFTTGSEGLRIEARKGEDGKWRAGLLSGRDFSGGGFSQTFGYFEARMKLPPGPGVWPAFWLITEATDPVKGELDIMEYYGRRPDRYESTLHSWPRDKAVKPSHDGRYVSVPSGLLSEGFHIFGASIDPDEIVIFFDRIEVVRFVTSAPFLGPVYMLLNLTLGPGWPIDQTPNPSYLHVDYVKAYARK